MALQRAISKGNQDIQPKVYVSHLFFQVLKDIALLNFIPPPPVYALNFHNHQQGSRQHNHMQKQWDSHCLLFE
jgi:hypothetical protein